MDIKWARASIRSGFKKVLFDQVYSEFLGKDRPKQDTFFVNKDGSTIHFLET